MNKPQSNPTQSTRKWLAILLCGGAALAIGVAMYVSFFGQKHADVHNYAACKAAGGRIDDTTPRQCVVDGKTFTNSDADDATADQNIDKPMTDEEINDAYIGLSEEEALARAAREDRPARVVARDDTSYNMTTDLRNGRLNFTIKDGKVTAVTMERIEIPQ